MIYFAQPKDGGPIRIGSSGDVDVRRRTLGVWLPGGISVVLEIEGGILGEYILHHCFDPIRVDRDWFKSCPDLWRFILDALNERPNWLPEEPDIAPKMERETLIEEFGGVDNAFKAIGYNSQAAFEQALKWQNKSSYAISARVIFQRLLREGKLPDFIAGLHGSKRDAKGAAA